VSEAQLTTRRCGWVPRHDPEVCTGNETATDLTAQIRAQGAEEKEGRCIGYEENSTEAQVVAAKSEEKAARRSSRSEHGSGIKLIVRPDPGIRPAIGSIA